MYKQKHEYTQTQARTHTHTYGRQCKSHKPLRENRLGWDWGQSPMHTKQADTDGNLRAKHSPRVCVCVSYVCVAKAKKGAACGKKHWKGQVLVQLLTATPCSLSPSLSSFSPSSFPYISFSLFLPVNSSHAAVKLSGRQNMHLDCVSAGLRGLNWNTSMHQKRTQI